MSKLRCASLQQFIDDQNKKTVAPPFSSGLLWLVSNEDGDPIQVWDGAEELVRSHCKKLRWTYTGITFFQCKEVQS